MFVLKVKQSFLMMQYRFITTCPWYWYKDGHSELC